MEQVLNNFIFFFAVIDPIGTVPVFLAVTAGYDTKDSRKIALQAIFLSTMILLFFLAAGELILDALQIPLPAFQIAGGIVLLLFALTMIFGESKPDEEIRLAKNTNEVAVFPLAVPSIASPGAMLAAVLLTDNSRYSLEEQVFTALAMVAVLLVALTLLLISPWINRLIGRNGASVVSRVMGLILSSIAVANILEGISVYFEL